MIYDFSLFVYVSSRCFACERHRHSLTVVDSRHRFTAINLNEMNAFDQRKQACYSYFIT